MVGVLLDEKQVVDAYDEWYDAAIHSATERPEFLLQVKLIPQSSCFVDNPFCSDYYGDTFFKSAGTTFVESQLQAIVHLSLPP